MQFYQVYEEHVKNGVWTLLVKEVLLDRIKLPLINVITSKTTTQLVKDPKKSHVNPVCICSLHTHVQTNIYMSIYKNYLYFKEYPYKVQITNKRHVFIKRIPSHLFDQLLYDRLRPWWTNLLLRGPKVYELYCYILMEIIHVLR